MPNNEMPLDQIRQYVVLEGGEEILVSLMASFGHEVSGYDDDYYAWHILNIDDGDDDDFAEDCLPDRLHH